MEKKYRGFVTAGRELVNAKVERGANEDALDWNEGIYGDLFQFYQSETDPDNKRYLRNRMKDVFRRSLLIKQVINSNS